MDTKICTQCKTEHPIEYFFKDNGTKVGPTGRKAYCKFCACRYRNSWTARNPDKKRGHDLKSRYGITLSEYTEMLRLQQGVCAICGGTCATFKFLCVDHNHTTGKIRKLLCSACNRGIACFKEEITRLKKAIIYLEEH